MKHHYVPASYLRLFVDPETPQGHEPYVWVADFGANSVENQAPKNVAYLPEHNVLIDREGRTDHAAERMLGEFESAAAPIFQRIANGDRHLDDKAFVAVIAFMAVQWVRTPAVRDGLQDWFLNGVRKLSTLMTRDRASYLEAVKANRPDLSPAEQERVFEFARDPANYTLSVHPSRALMDSFTLASHAEPILAKMHWSFIVSPERVFLTSDNPVTVMNPKAARWNYGHGLSNPDTEVTFPVAPTVCLWGTWAGPPGDVRATAHLIKAVNLRTVIWAEHECFAHSKQLAREALELKSPSDK